MNSLFNLIALSSVLVRAAPFNTTLSKRGITWPSTVSAPFVDVLLWPTFDVSSAAQSTGNKHYTLAFILADTSGNAAWGGVVQMKDKFYLSQIQSLRNAGGDVIISFGGAAGTYLASYHKDVATLQARYQSVIDTYSVSWVDFDVEGSGLADAGSIDRRNKAIAGLKRNNPGLVISFTLPVMPSGLTSLGINLLKNAVQNGLYPDVVNLMTMDYGIKDNLNMGQRAVSAAQKTREQLTGLGLSNSKIGVTPMIGVNDVPGEIFDLNDAKTVLNFCKQNSYIRWIGFWSMTRDTNINGPLYASSQIIQNKFDFVNTFKSFTGSSVSAPAPAPVTNPGTVPAPVAIDTKSNTGYNWPSKVFAPFVDATAWPTFDIVQMAFDSGAVNFALGFIVADSTGAPSWGGYYGLSANWYLAAIKNIRRFGGDVIISFGGAAGSELALVQTNVKNLQQTYQNVIDSYAIGWIDLDIEGPAIKDAASIDRRSQALRGLQVANPNLIISFTLPVMPSGLAEDGMNVLRSARNAGVRVDVVNIMAMNYGTNQGNAMGDATIAATKATYAQIQSLNMKSQVGITPMTGQNDIQTEFFTVQDAQKVMAWAKQQSWVRFVSYWSANRDAAGSPKYSFAKPFMTFAN